ncbi:MAG: zinc ribbon domain-containing protein [Thermoproteota archaeon]
MDERPLGVTIIAIADGILGLLVLMLGVLCWATISLSTDLLDLTRSIIQSYLLYDSQFYWLSIALGLSLVAGALGLTKISAWGYFLVLLNRFLLILLCIAYLRVGIVYLLIGSTIYTLLITTYLFRNRGFFFEAEPIQIQQKEEIVVPELPPTLTKPSEKTIRAEEIQKILATPRSVPQTCPSCGREIPFDASVCFHCGTPLKEPLEKFSGPSVSEAKLGKKMTLTSTMIFCIYCGKNPSNAEFCFRCGKKIWRG